ncbi:Type I acyl-CoA thioesterase mpaH [Exophiala dermatitidis]
MLLPPFGRRPVLRKRAGFRQGWTRKGLSRFRVIEHVVPTQHTRQWPRGTEVGYENALSLAVKQYVPKSNPEPQLGDITFIAAQGNGFPKEMYEPMLDDLEESMSGLGRRIRSIWIADMAHQGQSYVFNENAVGNDPNWWDFARDLLYLINQKQGDMPQPLVGVGHSMGGTQLAQLALLHPRLLQALVLIDPVIQTENPSKTYAPAATYRRDLWPSRQAAAEKFAASKFYQAWDPRVLHKWIESGLRELPTAMYPDRGTSPEPPVTLTTPKEQEVFSYLRPKYYGSPDVPPEEDWVVYGDIHPDDVEDYPFYRPEPGQTFRRLPELKPPVLYIFGAKSELATPVLRRKKMETTGTGIGGSGGQKNGKVEEVVLDCGHLVPMERVKECADAAARFSVSEVARWEDMTRNWQRRWLEKPRRARIGIDDRWKEAIGPRPSKQ